MSTTENDIISLNLRFRNDQNRNVIFVIEISKNDKVSDLEYRARVMLATYISFSYIKLNLCQINPTNEERRQIRLEDTISVYFPENPNEDWIHIIATVQSILTP